LNIRSTKRFFEENNIVALKADKNVSPEVNELLKELGNSSTAIPYYAVYSPGLKEPIHFGGNFLTGGAVQEVLQKALGETEETAKSIVNPVPSVPEVDTTETGIQTGTHNTQLAGA